ncbi:MAG: hypothetical protein ABIJ45_10260 [Candidatus Zixiibacteriota bacterium]
MLRVNRDKFVLNLVLMIVIGLFSQAAYSQISLNGDFRLRAYNDRFSEAMDDRGDENYLRHLARLRAKIQANPSTTVYTELITWTQDNPVSPVRNIGGTGRMQYGISQVYVDLLIPNKLIFDLIRLRVGRQQFPIGNGLSFGESYYFFDKFDGGRVDLSFYGTNLSLFGAITGQNLSASGLYPDPGSDQVFAARLARPLLKQNFMAYYIYHKLRGDFNDSYITGVGVSNKFLKGRLDYFLEFAKQFYNQLDGLPEMGGIGFMGGVGYRFAWGPFRSIKVETKFAAYQGDDADTEKIERFSPLYASFFWGSRRGYVNGAIGGDYPYAGHNPEGSKIWYSRIYFIPRQLPKFRLQFDFLFINEYVNNDDYNSMDDELAIKLYYKYSQQVQFQFRFARNFPNDDDFDTNESGSISWSEDRVDMTRFMLEMLVNF